MTEDKLKIGEKAPEFTLPSTENREIGLSDFKGKNVVLYFYPKDNTPGCTQQACDFRDSHGDFENSETIVIGVSRDSLNSHDKFLNKHQLPFILLSDENEEVCNLYGVIKEKKMFGKISMGIERSTFIIDKEGILRKVYRKVKVKNHIQEVLDFVKENL